MQITYDGTSLVNSPFTVRKMTHENADARSLYVYELARQRGGILLNSEYKPKKITLSGIITGTSNADLEGNIDEFKELVGRQGKNLDISYSSGTRRFVATAQSVKVERDFFHLNYAPYDLEFLVPAGVGINTTATTDETAGISDLAYVDTLTVGGSCPPKMKITVEFTDDDTITELSILANGSKITLTENLVTGDIVIFDENTLKVTLNGVEKDFSGIFPQFTVGANVFEIDTTATAAEYTLTFEYYNTYL